MTETTEERALRIMETDYSKITAEQFKAMSEEDRKRIAKEIDDKRLHGDVWAKKIEEANREEPTFESQTGIEENNSTVKKLKEILGLDILEQDVALEKLSKETKIRERTLRNKLKELKSKQDKIKEDISKPLESSNYSEEQIKEAKEKFNNKELLSNIQEELSKTHIGDNNLKMTTFFTATSGLLKNPKRRMSMAIKANTSEGKDNNIKTILRHMPKESFIFVTSATQATIEDDVKDKRIIAFSEVNANREAGANMYLTEVIKQKAEGGTSSLKKDIREGMKTARHDIGEQASVLFGTTESENDEELGTRFIEGNIKSNYEKIKKVNDNTLDTFSDIDKLLNDSQEPDGWIRTGLTLFFENPEQPEIYLPYAKFLKEQIENEDIFDHKCPRSQRDIKRILSLTCAVTYLFQQQREKIKVGDKVVLISEPQDLINTLRFTSEFFNQSYSGLDARLDEVLKIFNIAIKEKPHLNGWISRNELQERLEVTTNTIKGYCDSLVSEGCLEGIKGKELNQLESVKIYDGNRIYYQRCQKGIKKPLIRCQLLKLKEFLEEKTKNKIDTFDLEVNSDDKPSENDSKRYQNEGIKTQEENENNSFSGSFMKENTNKIEIPSKIDTFSLIPSNCSICGSDKADFIACGQKVCSSCSSKLKKQCHYCDKEYENEDLIELYGYPCCKECFNSINPGITERREEES